MKGIQEYQDKNIISDDYVLPTLNFTKDEQKRLDALKGQIDTYFAEKAQTWVMGGEDVEAGFDAYKAQLKNLGVEEYIQIYNDAYARYLSIQ
ncbi:hypothetical protein D3C77_690880 [compost metagenome]